MTVSRLSWALPDTTTPSGKTAGKPLLAVAQKLGAIAILEKPFVADELLATIGKGLEIQA